MAALPATLAIPEQLRAAIGSVIVNWAYLEWLLQETIYLAGEVSPKIGRMIVNEPRAKMRVKLIKDILQFRHLDILTDIDALIRDIEEVEDDRNNLAHGIWVVPSVNSQPMLRVARGTLDGAKYKMVGKVTRVQFPEVIECTADDCHEVARKIERLCYRAQALRAEVESISPPWFGSQHNVDAE